MYNLLSCFHELSWSAYKNKPKTTSEYVDCCFHMFSQSHTSEYVSI